jgi:hypothetical protein
MDVLEKPFPSVRIIFLSVRILLKKIKVKPTSLQNCRTYFNLHLGSINDDDITTEINRIMFSNNKETL